jgi:hypothetical protein
MWVPRPSDPDSVCDECKRGPDQGVGPFWQGPIRPTGRPGFGRRQMGRVHVCRECLFVVVNHPESPFHGFIPAGEAAIETSEKADRVVARLRARIEELEQAKPDAVVKASVTEALAEAPDGLVKAAVAAAVEELEARGAFRTLDVAPMPASKPKPRTAAKPKAA